ncbi:polysaccharide deacetylase family protein [Gordonia sp. NPDC003504]
MSRSRAAAAAVRRRIRRLRPRGGILMYHCVCAEACDPWAICIAPEHFDDQMAVLAEARAAVPLADFADEDGYTRDGSRLAVTFDDGYVDNLLVALPILEKYDIPATIFVVGNAVDRRREFWWDALQRAILGPTTLPEILDLPFGTGRQTFTSTDGWGAVADSAGWRADAEEPRNRRQQLFRTLWDAIVVLGPDEQDAAVDHLLEWAGEPEIGVSSRLPVTGEQFAELARHPLITLGGHTLDHVSLTDMALSDRHAQIDAGNRSVSELADAPVTQFAFPFGRFDAPTRNLLRDSDVTVGCTSVSTPATSSDDRHALPRLHATDMDGEAFNRWLRRDHAVLGRSAATVL